MFIQIFYSEIKKEKFKLFLSRLESIYRFRVIDDFPDERIDVEIRKNEVIAFSYWLKPFLKNDK